MMANELRGQRACNSFDTVIYAWQVPNEAIAVRFTGICKAFKM